MATSSEPGITLYDFGSTLTPQAWNPSVWKARLVLNYKRIPYNTVWISYSEVEPTLKKIGGAPTSTAPDDPGRPLYTLPAIVDTSAADPIVIADSLAIAEYLDAKYPDHPVLPKEGRALEHIFEEFFMSTVFAHLPPIMLPSVHDILEEPGKAYFRETRERLIGKKLEDLSPEGPVRDAQWAAVEKGFNALATHLEKNGPNVDFVAGGTEPTRADMIVVSFLVCIKAIAPEDGWNTRVRHWNGGRWEKLWKRSEEWRTVH